MPREQDYYSVLSVPRGANAEQIKAAYRKLARELHPDVNKAPDAPQRFQRVQEAYDVLGDPEKRAVYDRVGHTGFSAGARGGGAKPSGTYTWTNVGGAAPSGDFDFDMGDVGTIFEEIFGAGPRSGFGADPRARSRRHTRPSRGDDIHHEALIPFDVALRGGAHSVRVVRGGASQTIEVRIPKGAQDGAKLRVRGAGKPSATSGPPGDLILTLRTAPHALFKRDGLDVLLELPVTIAEATLGATINAPTPSGAVELKIPPGTPSGAKLRIRGRGAESADGKRGDFFAIVKIVPPKSVTDEDRAALERLAQRSPSPRTGPDWP